MTAPRVSVIIPSYNSADYLGTAISSVLAQRYRDFELIVVDDASSDRTQEVVRACTDPRVRLVANARNLGIPGARNRGIEAARGEYIAMLDADDYAYPQRLTRQIAFLDKHRDHAVVGAWANWMDPSGRFQKRGIKRRPLRAEDVASGLIFRSGLQQPSVTGRTALLRHYGYSEEFDLSSDFELWVRMAEHHKLANMPEVLVCCRSHGTSTTRTKAARVLDRQRAIFAYQLDALGVSYTADDLERHRLLPRPAKNDSPPAADELDWAEPWLQRLIAANRQLLYYPPNAFERTLGWGWLNACYRAAGHDRGAAFKRFMRSPLRAAALAGIGRQATLHTLHGLFRSRPPAGLSVPDGSPQHS